MKLNPSIKNMSNEYIFFTDQTALTFRICLVQYLAQEIRARNAGACASWRGRFATAHPESISTKITGRTNTKTLPIRTFIRQLQISTRTSVWHMISTQKTIRYTGHSLTARNALHFRSVNSRQTCRLCQF